MQHAQSRCAQSVASAGVRNLEISFCRLRMRVALIGSVVQVCGGSVAAAVLRRRA